MILQGKKIFLRAVLPRDVTILLQWENDRSNWNVSDTKKPFTKSEIENFIFNQKDIYLDKQLRLLIIQVASQLPVGCIDLFEFDQSKLSAGIGILIEKEFRQKGYGFESLGLLIQYSFKTLGLHKLLCTITESNSASVKLFLKHNFLIKGKKSNVFCLELVNNT